MKLNEIIDTVVGVVLVGSVSYIGYKLLTRQPSSQMLPHTLSEVNLVGWDVPGADSQVSVVPGGVIRNTVTWENLTNLELNAWFRLALKKSWDFWTGWPSSRVEGQWLKSTAAPAGMDSSRASLEVAIAVPADWNPGATIDVRLDLFGESGGVGESLKAYRVAEEIATVEVLSVTPLQEDVSDEETAQVAVTWRHGLLTAYTIGLRLDLRSNRDGVVGKWLAGPSFTPSTAPPQGQITTNIACPVRGEGYDNLTKDPQRLDAKLVLEGKSGDWWGPPGAVYEDPAYSGLFVVTHPALPPNHTWGISPEAYYSGYHPRGKGVQ